MVQWRFAGGWIVAIHDPMAFRWWADSDYTCFNGVLLVGR